MDAEEADEAEEAASTVKTNNVYNALVKASTSFSRDNSLLLKTITKQMQVVNLTEISFVDSEKDKLSSITRTIMVLLKPLIRVKVIVDNAWTN